MGRGMGLRRRLRRGRTRASTEGFRRGDHLDGGEKRKKPQGKIIVRFRPLLQHEFNQGETLCVTARGANVKLKIPNSNIQMPNSAPQPEQIEFHLDRAMAPTCDNYEVYETAAARLVDNVISGGDGLLLIAGTPGSGRSHTLWGGSPPSDEGLFSLSLDALARAWRGGTDGNARVHSLPASPPPNAFALRLCAAEVCGAEVKDLVQSASGTNETHQQRPGSPGRQTSGNARWTFSTRGLLSSILSPSRNSRAGGADGEDLGGRSPGRGGAATKGGLGTSRVLVGVSEISVGNVKEAVQLMRHSVQKRTKTNHLVMAVRLVASDESSVGPGAEDGTKATGELVFVQIGDCSAGDLPVTLRTALAHLQIKSSVVSNPLGKVKRKSARTVRTSRPGIENRSVSCSSLQQQPGLRATAAMPETTTGSSLGVTSTFSFHGDLRDSPLLDLLDSIAGNDPGQTMPAGQMRQTRARSSSLSRVVTGTIGPAFLDREVSGGWGNTGPLLVSVVTTLRAGTGHFAEKKALLEVLAKSKRMRSGKALSLNRIISIPSFVRRSQASHDGSTAVLNTVPSAPPMSPSSSGSASSTVHDSSAKARTTLQPPIFDSSTSSYPQQATSPFPPLPPPPPPPTPPRSVSPTSRSAAAAATSAEINPSETKASGCSLCSISCGCSQETPLVQVLPQHETPVLQPSSPAAFVAHTLARQQTSTAGGLEPVSEPSLTAIVELSPWTEGVREVGVKGRGGKVPARGAHRKGEKREISAVSAWERSMVEQAGRRKHGDDVRWSRGRPPVPKAPVAVESKPSPGSSEKKSIGHQKENLEEQRTRGGEEAPGDRAAGEEKVSVQLEPAEPGPAAVDSGGRRDPRIECRSFDSGEDDRSTPSSWGWQVEGRQDKDERLRSPSWDGLADLRAMTREELIIRLEQAENAVRFWKVQHANMAKQFESFIREKSSQPPRAAPKTNRSESGMETQRELATETSDEKEGVSDSSNRGGNREAARGLLAAEATHIETAASIIGGRYGGYSGQATDSVKGKGGGGGGHGNYSGKVTNSAKGEGGGGGGHAGNRVREASSSLGVGGEGKDSRAALASPREAEVKASGASLTPPGTAEAKRTIRASKVPFKARRAVFAKNGSAVADTSISVASTVSSPPLPIVRRAIERSLFSFQSTESDDHIVKRDAMGYEESDAADIAVVSARDRKLHASRSPAASHESASTLTLKRAPTSASHPELYYAVFAPSPSSTDHKAASLSPPPEVPAMSPPIASEPSSAADDTKSVADPSRNSLEVSRSLGPSSLYSFASPPSFRKPNAERRARELENLEADLRAVRARKNDASSPTFLQMGEERTVDGGSLHGGNGVPEGVSAGDWTETELQLSEMALGTSGGFPRSLPGLRPGGRRSWMAGMQQSGSGLETGVRIIASLASSSMPVSPLLSAPRPNLPSDTSSPPMALARLAPRAPTSPLRAGAVRAFAATAPVSHKTGIGAATPSPVAAWIPNTLRPSVSPRTRLEKTIEISMFGSPWSATALRQKALTRQQSSSPGHERRKKHSASPEKQSHKQHSGSGGHRRRRLVSTSPSSSSSRFAPWSLGSEGGRNRRWGSVSAGGQSTKIWKRRNDSRSGHGPAGSSEDWKDKTTMMGSWPLRDRPSSSSALSSGCLEEAKEPPPADHPSKLSISHISAEHAAGLQQLRERAENKEARSLGTRPAAPRALATGEVETDKYGSGTSASGRSKLEGGMMSKPWRSGSSVRVSADIHGGGGSGGGRFKVGIPVKWHGRR